MARVGTAFAWLVPALIAVELVGTLVNQTLTTTLLLLAFYAGALFLPIEPDPEAGVPLAPRQRWIHRGFGALMLAIGGGALAFGITRFFEPGRFPPQTLPAWLREFDAFVLVPVLACWPLALAIPWLLGRRLSGRDFERAGLFVALVFLTMFLAKLKIQGQFVLPYAKPWIGTLLWICIAVVVAVAFAPRLPPIARLGSIVVAAVVLRAVGLESWKLDPATRDMLPLVKSAQDAFAAGDNPYALHPMQRGSVVPLTYLPGMWMLHGVSRLVGLDLRWAGILADATVAIALWWAASGVEPRFRERARALALSFGAAWMFSPGAHWNGIFAEPHAWWLVLSVLLAATLRRRYWLAAGVLGVALATRHFALVVAPFVVLALWRDLGWRQALPRVGLTGAVAAVLLVPFVLRDPETFWFGTYRWLVEYGPAHESWFWYKFGFVGYFYKAKATEWIARVQLGVVLAMLALAAVLWWRRRPRFRELIGPAGAAYLLFVMNNGIIWDSFFLGAALFPAFAAAGAHPAPVVEPKPVARRVLIAGAVAAALSAIAGIGLLVSLGQSFSTTGKGELRARLARDVKPGDALVDRSDWQLAFIRSKPVFFGSAPPTRAVGYHPFDRAFGGTGAFEAPRVWLVTRAARDAALRSELRAFGSANEEQVGRYVLTSVAPGKALGRLSTMLDRLTPSYAGQPLTAAGQRWTSPAVTYVDVLPRPCRIGGAMRPMLYAHPATGAELRLSFSGLDLGQRLLVFGGIEDPVVLWGRADVALSVVIDGQAAADLTIENFPQASFRVIDTARWAEGVHQVELVLTTHDDTQRFTCVEAIVLE